MSTLESFIDYCDNYQIANEGFLTSVKNKIKQKKMQRFGSKDNNVEVISRDEFAERLPEDKKVYRVEYNGNGIYEEFRLACTDDEWNSFLNSNAAKWLPKPKTYKTYNKSYFTSEGYKKFKKETLPIIQSKLEKENIITSCIPIPHELTVAYKDKYQIITKDYAMES